MALYKRSDADVVILEDPDISEDDYTKELTSTLLAVHKYENDMSLLLTLIDGLNMGDSRHRAASVDAIDSLFSESGSIAGLVMNANGMVLKNMSDILTDKMIAPTLKLRTALYELKIKSGEDKLGKSILLLDGIINFMNFRLASWDLEDGALFVNNFDGGIN